jgi:hypothetical protein
MVAVLLLLGVYLRSSLVSKTKHINVNTIYEDEFPAAGIIAGTTTAQFDAEKGQ